MYLTEKNTEKTFSVFSLTNLILFCIYKKQRMWRLQKQLQAIQDWKGNNVLEGSTISSLTGIRWGYQDWVWNKHPPKVLSLKARMGRGSSLCAKLCEIIISQFKDVQRFFSSLDCKKIISPSTVHNIVKRFRESGEISEHKGQGQKPLLNARDHRALRRYCLRNRHATMMNIATWAREHFGKSLSAAASWNCIMQRGRHLLILSRNDAEFSGPKVIWDGPKDSGNVLSGQTSQHFSLFLGKTDIGFYVPKMTKPIQTGTNAKVQKQPLWWYGGASVPTAWVICMWRQHQCEGLCWDFGETYAAVKTTAFLRNSMFISAGQCQASFCTSCTNSLAS